MSITYLTGDATQPHGGGDRKIIAHVCNDVGSWGKGFVMALSARWKGPEKAYRQWFRQEDADNPFRLGAVQIVAVAGGLQVANLVAQHKIARRSTGPRSQVAEGPRIQFDALRACLSQLANYAKDAKASVHMPRIGCGLGGGKWEDIEPIITETLLAQNVPVFVYDLA